MSAQNQIEIWAHYLTKEQGRSPATVREYLKDVRPLRSWLDAEDKPQHLRGRDWGELSAADLRAFLATADPSPRRFHRLVNSWRSFWRFLVRVQKLPGVQDITAELTTPKIPKRAPVKLTLEDVAKLLDVVYRDKSPQRGLRNWCIVAFLYGTGLRISEMLALKFSDIEYQDGQPVAVRVIGKGDKERRVLPDRPDGADALAAGTQDPREPGHALGVVAAGRETVRPTHAGPHHREDARRRCRAGRTRPQDRQPAQAPAYLRHRAPE